MHRREVAGFLLAPVIPSVLGAVALGALLSNWSGILKDIAIVSGIAELSSVLVGIPVYFMLRKVRRIGILECVVAGGLIGVWGGLIGGVVGATSGLLFWLIAINPMSGKPNKAHQPMPKSGAAEL